MNIVLIGGMAALGKELIEARIEGPCRIEVIADQAEAPRRRDLLERAEVLVGWPLTPEIAAAALNARLIQLAGAGVDGVSLHLLRPGVVVANTYHHETSVAEHIVMAMLMLTRQPVGYDRRLRQGDWADSCIWGEFPRLGDLAGVTALLIGLGHIARAVACRARPFGVRIIAVSRNPARAAADVDLVAGYDTWRDHLREADFVIPTCPLTRETEGLISAAELTAMKPSAHLINIARGPIVDEEALYNALRERSIAGAAIDVWYQYPTSPADRVHPSRFPFHELDNVLMTPHLTGWTRRTFEGRMRDIADNINRLAAGMPLRNVVHP